MAMIHAEDEADAPSANRISKPRSVNRGSLPKHLTRVRRGYRARKPDLRCGGCLHRIGEDVSSGWTWSRHSSA